MEEMVSTAASTLTTWRVKSVSYFK